VGASILSQVEAIDLDLLPHDLTLTLRLVRFRAGIWAREADWYWLAFDAMGFGTFALFMPTAYGGGWLLSAVRRQLALFAFNETGDTDRYLALVSDYARLIDQFAERTAGQADRNIRMPRVQLLQARDLLHRFKNESREALTVAPDRLPPARSECFEREIHKRLQSVVEPAFDRAIAGLSNKYEGLAPERVGLDQYPGGLEVYSEMIKMYTTLDLTPEEVHERGRRRMAEIEQGIRSVQIELGFHGNGEEFATFMNRDTRWRATSEGEVTATFQRYIDRLAPHLENSFASMPKAAYGVAALPEALQASMTYGYYDPPRSDPGVGQYFYNAPNLTSNPLFHIAALTYHELMPGHHMHFSSQQENRDFHPVRRHSFVNAYVEGWAEYAATYAGEIGMYEQPQERYGRLIMDAFLTSRLVVDTGMNALRWSLERARDYMRQHSRLAESEICTETIRYACDIPGQALAYKLGDTCIIAMRERMRVALGDDFDIKVFHAAVLGAGAVPLPVLEWHVQRETRRIQGLK